MAIMHVFLGDAFSARSITAAVDRYVYVPNFLEMLPGLFTQQPYAPSRSGSKSGTLRRR
jgi:hypothetical protein